MDQKRCQICGRKAVYVYFGALSCSACKVFFRRNAQKGLLTTLSLLQSDNSTLTTEEWNAISNLSHCYDEYSGFERSENYMKEQSILPAELRFESQSFIKFFQEAFQQVELVYVNNKDFLSLSLEDRSLLLNNTIQYVVGLSTNFIIYKSRLTNCPTYYDAIATIAHPRIIPVAKRIQKQVDFDLIIMKMFLGIYCFSTINYTDYVNSPPVNLTNPKQVLQIQNKYIELAWKYLLHKLGFEETVKAFAYILRYLLLVNEGIVQSKCIEWFSNTMDSIAEQTELLLITN